MAGEIAQFFLGFLLFLLFGIGVAHFANLEVKSSERVITRDRFVP